MAKRQEITITGIVRDVDQRRSSSGGNIWRCLVEVEQQGAKSTWIDRYPVTFFGDDNGVPREGEAATVRFFVKPREWQGKWFVDLRGVAYEPIADADTPAQEIEVPQATPPAADEDLPF